MSNGATPSWMGDAFSELLVDQIAAMLEKEDSFYSCVDYLGELPDTNKDVIDEYWRQTAAEWMFKVIDFYDLDRDIVSELCLVHIIMLHTLKTCIFTPPSCLGQCWNGIP